ncbi:hypothetical protein BDK51DRAFT_47766 [Blyttiomyces helicus]|uniref:Uncharacterized protein n=1 Tax=Blyttiomyces helicus TaxID=388810 RepID=A0A4P9W0K3_9FUNG|nr:hypothetical protein BDK51DRAFT_47766 [Blyttiomyces helicus]|eukprot:RKO85659.1 hypothetical protein BDK51DRAFT_47766 [Blyttiomyces helicus]
MPVARPRFWKTKKGVRFMRGISRLRVLRFYIHDVSYTRKAGSATARAHAFTCINKCIGPALEHWHADGPPDSQICAVARAPNLKHLTFAHNMHAFAVLHHSPALRSVCLPDNIKDFDALFLSMLTACPLLDELDLGSNMVDERGFIALVEHQPRTPPRPAMLAILARSSSSLTLLAGAMTSGQRSSCPRRHVDLSAEVIQNLIDGLPDLDVIGVKRRDIGGNGLLRIGPVMDDSLMKPNGLDLVDIAGVGGMQGVDEGFRDHMGSLHYWMQKDGGGSGMAVAAALSQSSPALNVDPAASH